MMRRIVALVAAVFAFTAAAQDARRTVTAGEYPGVSRLVISFPDRPEWRLGQSAGKLTLRVAGPPVSFDLTRAMPRLPTGRVTSIEAQSRDAELGIMLGCDCGVRAYLMDDRYLVIDVVDDVSAGNPDFAQPLLPSDPVDAMTRAPAHSFAEPGVGDRPLAVRVSGPLGETALVLENLRLTQALLPDVALSPELPDGLPLLPPPDTLAARRAVTDALANEVARASSLGLLDPRLTAPDPGEPAPEPPLARTGSGNIRINMGLDPATGVAPPPLETPLLACPPQRHFDIAAWGNADGDLWADISNARATVFDPFDMPRADAVRDLSRLYLHMTFGAEARTVLAQLGAPSSDHDILAALAALIDAPGVIDNPTLAAYQECGSLGRMWALLAGAAPPDVQADTNGVLLQFARLPRHLRLHLGPHLAGRFLDLGQEGAALTVRNATPKPVFGRAPAVQLIDARLADEGLRVEEPAELSALSQSSSPEAAAALIALIDQAIDLGRPVEADIVDSAGLMAFERAGTPDATALRSAEIRGRVSRAEYFLALETLDKALQSGAVQPAEGAQLRFDVYAHAVAEARDAAFVQLIFDPASQRFLSAAPSGLRLDVAARLANLGFSARAADVLSTLPDRESADVRRVRAQIALAEGRPNDAASLLSPPITADDAALVVTADLAAGRYRDARDRCTELGDTDCALRATLRARDWADLPASAPPPIRATADIATTEAPAPLPGAPPTLAEAQEVIDATRAARIELDNMLRVLPPPNGNGS